MIASTTRRVALGDGQHTTLEIWGEAGPVLLGVHGITSSRKSWARMAQHFAASHRVCAYDQRGHGDSAGVLGPMRLERSLADLDAVMATLGDPVDTLLGHSWGGAVALLGGIRFPVRRVVAIDPMIHQAPGSWYAEFVDELRVILSAPPDARAAQITNMYAGLAEIEVAAKIHAMQHMTIDPIISLGDENDVDRGGWDLRERIQNYPKPLLMLLADPSESIVSASDTETVRATLGEHATIEVFEGEGHSLQRTAFERFAARVEAFQAAT